MISQERLKSLFTYRGDGALIRIALPSIHSHKEKIGDRLGSIDALGYYVCRVDMIDYKVHRLVWHYHYGEIPSGYEIDHINGNPSDNRIENLRCVSKQDNLRNKKLYSGNSSGIAGVHFHRHNNRWVARISVNRERLPLGSFSDFFEACCSRKSAEITYGFHPNHGAAR